MKFTKTNIVDCYIIEPNFFEDSRGYFFESFNQREFEKIIGTRLNFVQDNQSKSSYGVIRGLHGQKEKYAQAKLVRVLEGNVIDIVLDIRKDSSSFGKIFRIELSADNKKQLFIPKGCLHGFSIISNSATFFYKCDEFYNKNSEIGVYPLDSDLNIDWGINKAKITLSEKDKNAISWSDFNKTILK